MLIVCKEVKGYGIGVWLEGLFFVFGVRIIVLEDVVIIGGFFFKVVW